jgi:hypothetical protein
MAIGDVIGSEPGPWWFDMDGAGTKSRRFATKGQAEDAGRIFEAAVAKSDTRQAAIDAENAAKAVEDDSQSAATMAAWQAMQGRGR